MSNFVGTQPPDIKLTRKESEEARMDCTWKCFEGQPSCVCEANAKLAKARAPSQSEAVHS